MYYDNDTDENLDFIKDRIKDIRIALFKSEINSELQLPNNIIQTLKVDEDGTVWFFTSCSGDYAKNLDKSFYAYLDYYKKGTDCRLQVSGVANIVEDENDMLSVSNYSRNIAGRLVLVKMKIMQAEYFETRPQVNESWFERMKMAVAQLFINPSHRVYDFTS